MIGRGLGYGEAFSFQIEPQLSSKAEQEISVLERELNRYDCREVSLVNQTSYLPRTRGPNNVVKRPMMIQHHSRTPTRVLFFGRIVHFMKQT